MSVRIKSTRNSENSWTWRTNPSFFRTKIQASTVKSMAVLRDSILNLHHWTVFPCNSSASSLPRAANSNAITEASLRRRGKEIQRVRTGEEGRRKLPVYFRIQAKESTNRTKSKSVWRLQFKSLSKTQVKRIKHTFLSFKDSYKFRIDVNPWKLKRVRFENCKTLTKSLKTKTSTIYNEYQSS